MLPCGRSQREAELRRHSGNQPAQMHHPDAFCAEYALKVEVGGLQSQAHLAGAVVPHARPAEPEAAVGHIDLVAVAPRPALRHLHGLHVHPAGEKIPPDEIRHRAPGDESSQHLDAEPKVGGHAGDIGLRAGRLKRIQAAGAERLPRRGRQPDSGTSRN